MDDLNQHLVDLILSIVDICARLKVSIVDIIEVKMSASKRNNMKTKVLERINSLPDKSIIRANLADLGSSRQISRALKSLVEEGRITRLGYGIYAKLKTSGYTGQQYLAGGFSEVVREALTKLCISWELSKSEQAYLQGKSTQVPANPPTRLKDRFRRKLEYNNMEFTNELVSGKIRATGANK